MAVLSTLRVPKTISTHQRAQIAKHCSEDQILYNAENSMAPPFALDQPSPTIESTFGIGLQTNASQFDGYGHFYAGYGHRQTPTDGGKEKVWHCSDCGDGPYGTWQVSCQACGHKKCGSCEVEEA
jgi:hypothetical protein